MGKRFFTAILALVAVSSANGEEPFAGRHYRGSGEYVRLLDTARRFFGPDAQYQNLAILYEPKWNGLVEGPTWDAWWIQNSYGTTLCALPFLQEPWLTFLQNAQDLWFDQMGDGKRAGENNWVAPDGCLCDAARPGWVMYRQGDGKIHIHDWGMEFTAAGVVLQAELLLISRDVEAINKYLPKLRRCADFIESRRDPKNDLFLAGPAGNLLAPSYAGWKKPDGTYDKAYLAGLSVTSIAALDRLIELETLGGDVSRAAEYRQRRDRARKGLENLATEEGYFIRSLDPDGTKHGVYGAARHGYFEASPNHDAIALHIVDDAQARRIMAKIDSIPELRPHGLILPNYPSYDDMYENPQGLWGYGTWVNGGHWSTCEARMMLVYARLNRFDDIMRSMRKMMTFADAFRLDNPLVDRGNAVYQPNEPINLCYDSLGPMAAMIRGLFEYRYSAETLTLIPHVPESVTSLDQLDPIRWGTKRLFISMRGAGAFREASVNAKALAAKDGRITLRYGDLPDQAFIAIARGDARAEPAGILQTAQPATPFLKALAAGGYRDGYEYAHAAVAEEARQVAAQRKQTPTTLPARSAEAAQRSYEDSARKLGEGLQRLLETYAQSPDARKRAIAKLSSESRN